TLQEERPDGAQRKRRASFLAGHELDLALGEVVGSTSRAAIDRAAREDSMLKVTRDLMLPTAITGSYPRPMWFDASLGGRSFKAALGDSMFREQYLDAVACVINAQEAAGLDIVTDGDSRFDLAVGGKSWFFYPIERLGGIEGHRDTSRGWMQ